MGPVIWIALFAAVSALAVWVIFFDGTHRMSWLAPSYLLGADMEDWSEDGLRFFVGVVWLFAAGWFFYGLVSPGARFAFW